MTSLHDSVSPTAWIVAYRRTFSDIPFTRDIFKELDKLRGDRFPDITDEMLNPPLSPQYEARQKIIDKYILSYGTRQILELAAGFSSRGMDMTEDKDVTFVELDLPKVLQDKKKIASSILQAQGMQRPNLYFESGDALQYQDIQRATEHFSQEPITVVNEGFLRYLDFEQKATVAKNVYQLLQTYGGQWITSDITLKKPTDKEDKVTIHNRKIAKMTGIDIDKNRFENEAQAQTFFEDLGFIIERHSFNEVRDQLVSPKRLKLSEDAVGKLIDHAIIYIMRTKK